MGEEILAPKLWLGKETICPNCHKKIIPQENPEEGTSWCSECGYEL